MLTVVGGTLEDWGIIPTFLDENDPRSAKEQFDAKYISGWSPFPGFKLNKDTMVLSYPGDPPLKMVSIMFFRGETIVMYPYSWVMILGDGDDGWEICRMD